MRASINDHRPLTTKESPMTAHLEAVTMSNDTSWTWHVMPLLAAALALGVVFFPEGNLVLEEEAAAQSMSTEASPMTIRLVPSPQAGAGEPELKAEDLPQSF
jgi:hypothetical protein